MAEHNNNKRVRDDSDELDLDLPEVKRIREDLLDILDESDPDPATHDLDSVMKSFEKEISASSSSSVRIVDLTSECGKSRPDLGFLLEASDDELGLPPSSIKTTSDEVKSEGTELVQFNSDNSSGVGELWGYEEQVPSYDLFGSGVLENYSTDYVVFDEGLFEYANICFDSSEVSDYSWRLGSMPAEWE